MAPKINKKVGASRYLKVGASRYLRSTIASFEVEGITPSRQALNYCRLRDSGKISCKQEIEALKKKYMAMALK